MFQGTSITTAPQLPATTLATNCYSAMFYGCPSLVNAPELPATTLAEECYAGMFHDCPSLVNAPELPATTLADGCYSEMFYGCTNLNYVKCLATDITANDCTYCWVSNVAESGTFTKDTSMNDWDDGENGIPEGWIIEDASA